MGDMCGDAGRESRLVRRTSRVSSSGDRMSCCPFRHQRGSRNATTKRGEHTRLDILPVSRGSGSYRSILSSRPGGRLDAQRAGAFFDARHHPSHVLFELLLQALRLCTGRRCLLPAKFSENTFEVQVPVRGVLFPPQMAYASEAQSLIAHDVGANAAMSKTPRLEWSMCRSGGNAHNPPPPSLETARRVELGARAAAPSAARHGQRRRSLGLRRSTRHTRACLFQATLPARPLATRLGSADIR